MYCNREFVRPPVAENCTSILVSGYICMLFKQNACKLLDDATKTSTDVI